MAIIIPNHRIEIPQMVKLFSNPVSGISCIMDPKSNYNLAHGGYYHLANIRYSKSMILGALSFWSDQLFKFYLKVTKITNPLAPTKDIGAEINHQLDGIDALYHTIKLFPDSFLYSHRYIEVYQRDQHTAAMEIQLKLLKQKYDFLTHIGLQKQKMDPFVYVSAPYDIAVTVFPNEHPYIRRTVIAEVGQTKNGNTFVIKRNE